MGPVDSRVASQVADSLEYYRAAVADATTRKMIPISSFAVPHSSSYPTMVYPDSANYQGELDYRYAQVIDPLSLELVPPQLSQCHISRQQEYEHTHFEQQQQNSHQHRQSIYQQQVQIPEQHQYRLKQDMPQLQHKWAMLNRRRRASGEKGSYKAADSKSNVPSLVRCRHNFSGFCPEQAEDISKLYSYDVTDAVGQIYNAVTPSSTTRSAATSFNDNAHAALDSLSGEADALVKLDGSSCPRVYRATPCVTAERPDSHLFSDSDGFDHRRSHPVRDAVQQPERDSTAFEQIRLYEQEQQPFATPIPSFARTCNQALRKTSHKNEEEAEFHPPKTLLLSHQRSENNLTSAPLYRVAAAGPSETTRSPTQFSSSFPADDFAPGAFTKQNLLAVRRISSSMIPPKTAAGFHKSRSQQTSLGAAAATATAVSAVSTLKPFPRRRDSSKSLFAQEQQQLQRPNAATSLLSETVASCFRSTSRNSRKCFSAQDVHAPEAETAATAPTLASAAGKAQSECEESDAASQILDVKTDRELSPAKVLASPKRVQLNGLTDRLAHIEGLMDALLAEAAALRTENVALRSAVSRKLSEDARSLTADVSSNSSKVHKTSTSKHKSQPDERDSRAATAVRAQELFTDGAGRSGENASAIYQLQLQVKQLQAWLQQRQEEVDYLKREKRHPTMVAATDNPLAATAFHSTANSHAATAAAGEVSACSNNAEAAAERPQNTKNGECVASGIPLKRGDHLPAPAGVQLQCDADQSETQYLKGKVMQLEYLLQEKSKLLEQAISNLRDANNAYGKEMYEGSPYYRQQRISIRRERNNTELSRESNLQQENERLTRELRRAEENSLLFKEQIKTTEETLKLEEKKSQLLEDSLGKTNKELHCNITRVRQLQQELHTSRRYCCYLERIIRDLRLYVFCELTNSDSNINSKTFKTAAEPRLHLQNDRRYATSSSTRALANHCATPLPIYSSRDSISPTDEAAHSALADTEDLRTKTQQTLVQKEQLSDGAFFVPFSKSRHEVSISSHDASTGAAFVTGDSALSKESHVNAACVESPYARFPNAAATEAALDAAAPAQKAAEALLREEEERQQLAVGVNQQVAVRRQQFPVRKAPTESKSIQSRSAVVPSYAAQLLQLERMQLRLNWEKRAVDAAVRDNIVYSDMPVLHADPCTSIQAIGTAEAEATATSVVRDSAADPVFRHGMRDRARRSRYPDTDFKGSSVSPRRRYLSSTCFGDFSTCNNTASDNSAGDARIIIRDKQKKQGLLQQHPPPYNYPLSKQDQHNVECIENFVAQNSRDLRNSFYCALPESVLDVNIENHAGVATTAAAAALLPDDFGDCATAIDAAWETQYSMGSPRWWLSSKHTGTAVATGEPSVTTAAEANACPLWLAANCQSNRRRDDSICAPESSSQRFSNRGKNLVSNNSTLGNTLRQQCTTATTPSGIWSVHGNNGNRSTKRRHSYVTTRKKEVSFAPLAVSAHHDQSRSKSVGSCARKPAIVQQTRQRRQLLNDYEEMFPTLSVGTRANTKTSRQLHRTPLADKKKEMFMLGKKAPVMSSGADVADASTFKTRKVVPQLLDDRAAAVRLAVEMKKKFPASSIHVKEIQTAAAAAPLLTDAAALGSRVRPRWKPIC